MEIPTNKKSRIINSTFENINTVVMQLMMISVACTVYCVALNGARTSALG
jgi:hypothetical protein